MNFLFENTCRLTGSCEKQYSFYIVCTQLPQVSNMLKISKKAFIEKDLFIRNCKFFAFSEEYMSEVLWTNAEVGACSIFWLQLEKVFLSKARGVPIEGIHALIHICEFGACLIQITIL